MRCSRHLGGSQLALLSLALLCPVPWTAPAHAATALRPLEEGLELESAPPQCRAAPRVLRGPEAMEDEREGQAGSWEGEELLRAQRGDPMARPLSPFPRGHSLDSMLLQDGEDGGKRNEALTSIAGGLQAASREKGGFGFRFGRKRWTDRGWRDEGRGFGGREGG